MTYTQSVKEWLMQCPAIRADRIYFNYLSAGDRNQCFQTVENSTSTEDILGNEIGKYTFAVIDFRSLTKNPLFRTSKDLDSLADAGQINEWLRAQRRARNFPVFDGAVVDDIEVPPEPVFAAEDKSEGMNLAKYMIQVVIHYTKFN